MSQKFKDGKLVVSKEAETYFNTVLESNPFARSHGSDLYVVPPKIKKQIEGAGYEMRFINEAQYKAASNAHMRYWVPYTHTALQDSEGKSIGYEPGLGLSPDGALRRKGDILAIRPRRLGDMHRAMIKEKTEAQARQAESDQQTFKEDARRKGFKVEDID